MTSDTMKELKQLFAECEQIKQEADCLFTEDEMNSAIKKMALEITQQLSESHPLILGVMNGGLIPLGLLVTQLDFPLQMDYLHATRYRNETQGGQLDWLVSPRIALQDRTVLLVDDIHDEGLTLEIVKQYCLQQGACQVYTAVLVNKLHDRKKSQEADFIALDIPDRYVFGFGMDYKGLLRHVPGIYAVKNL